MNFSKTSVNKITSLFMFNLVNSSPFLKSNILIKSFVLSISSSLGHLDFQFTEEVFFLLNYQQVFYNHR